MRVSHRAYEAAPLSGERHIVVGAGLAVVAPIASGAVAAAATKMTDARCLGRFLEGGKAMTKDFDMLANVVAVDAAQLLECISSLSATIGECID